MPPDEARSEHRAPRRQRANVTVDAEILADAKTAGINLSRTLEIALVEELRARRKADWQRENADAIADYNKRIARRGVFGEEFRRF